MIHKTNKGEEDGFNDEVDLKFTVRLPTCNEQRVHARRRLGGLEHLADVLLRQGGLSPALPLGVLLLPPLEVLLGDSSAVKRRTRRGGGTRRCVQRNKMKTWKDGKGVRRKTRGAAVVGGMSCES